MRKSGKRRNPWQLPSGKLAAWYLFRELGRPFNDFEKFWRVVKAACRRERWLYRKFYLLKRNGKKRLILDPCPELKLVQKAINKKILEDIPVSPHVFGFSGGSVRDALMPIVKSGQPVFCADVKDAFPSTDPDESVWKFFRKQGFGRNVSYFLTHLCTWNYIPGPKKDGVVVFWDSALPQGAPTSPRLFDLCFEPLDIKLAKFAAKIGGVYTRYADNIFITAPTFWPARKFLEEFTVFDEEEDDDWGMPVHKVYRLTPQGRRFIDRSKHGAPIWHSPVISAVFQIVANRTKKSRWRGQSYKLHKCFLCDQGQILHALGLNLIDGQLHNKREFKHRLRLVLYNLRKALDSHEDFETKVWPLYQQANGMEQFAIKETLPAKLVQDCDDLLLRVFKIRYSGPSGTWAKNPQY